MKMNEISNLLDNLMIDAEWADAHSWDVPICLYDDLWDAMYAIRGSAIYDYDELSNILESLRFDVEWVKSNKIEELEDLAAPVCLYDDLLDAITVIEAINKGNKEELYGK